MGMSVMKPRRPWLMPIRGQAVGGYLPANAQHGAIAAHHQAQIALLANFGHFEGGVKAQAQVFRGALFEYDLGAHAADELGNIVQNPARALQGGARNCGVVLAKQRDVTKF